MFSERGKAELGNSIKHRGTGEPVTVLQPSGKNFTSQVQYFRATNIVAVVGFSLRINVFDASAEVCFALFGH